MLRPFKRTNKVFSSWLPDKTHFRMVVLGVIDAFIVMIIHLKGLVLLLQFWPETVTRAQQTQFSCFSTRRFCPAVHLQDSFASTPSASLSLSRRASHKHSDAELKLWCNYLETISHLAHINYVKTISQCNRFNHSRLLQSQIRHTVQRLWHK